MGHSINLPCASFNRVDGAHVHLDALENTWMVKDFIGSSARHSEREKPQLEGSEVGLDAGRGDWVPTSWWCSPSQGFGKDWGAPGGFGMRRGHSRVPARLIGDCYSSSLLWGNALAPSSRMPPWLACLINWSEWWENERTTQGSHFPCWTLLLRRLESTFLQV